MVFLVPMIPHQTPRAAEGNAVDPPLPSKLVKYLDNLTDQLIFVGLRSDGI